MRNGLYILKSQPASEGIFEQEQAAFVTHLAFFQSNFNTVKSNFLGSFLQKKEKIKSNRKRNMQKDQV